MLYKYYLRKGTVYLPTTVNQGTALYMDVDPVTVVSATNGGLTARYARYDSSTKRILSLPRRTTRMLSPYCSNTPATELVCVQAECVGLVI